MRPPRPPPARRTPTSSAPPWTATGRTATFWDLHPELHYLPIESWQIWNEQNSPFFFRPQVDPESYAALLEAAAAKIRAADPDAEDRPRRRVQRAGHRGGCARLGSLPERAVRGPRGSPTASTRSRCIPTPAAFPRSSPRSDAARQAAEQAGDGGVGLWVTELGWASDGKPSENLVKTPEGQAMALERSFGTLIDRREQYHLRGIYWYSWRDTEPGERRLRLVRVLRADRPRRTSPSRRTRRCAPWPGARIGSPRLG